MALVVKHFCCCKTYNYFSYLNIFSWGNITVTKQCYLRIVEGGFLYFYLIFLVQMTVRNTVATIQKVNLHRKPLSARHLQYIDTILNTLVAVDHAVPRTICIQTQLYPHWLLQTSTPEPSSYKLNCIHTGCCRPVHQNHLHTNSLVSTLVAVDQYTRTIFIQTQLYPHWLQQTSTPEPSSYKLNCIPTGCSRPEGESFKIIDFRVYF